MKRQQEAALICDSRYFEYVTPRQLLSTRTRSKYQPDLVKRIRFFSANKVIFTSRYLRTPINTSDGLASTREANREQRLKMACFGWEK